MNYAIRLSQTGQLSTSTLMLPFFSNRSMELSYDGEHHCGKGEFSRSRDFSLSPKPTTSIDCTRAFVSLGLVGDISYPLCS